MALPASSPGARLGGHFAARARSRRGRDEEVVEVAQPHAGDDPLDAHPAAAAGGEEAAQRPLLLVARRQLGVAALRGNGEHALAGADEQRHAEPGAGAEQHRVAGLGNAAAG